MPLLASLHRRFKELIPELTKFGVVGLIGSVIDRTIQSQKVRFRR